LDRAILAFFLLVFVTTVAFQRDLICLERVSRSLELPSACGLHFFASGAKNIEAFLETFWATAIVTFAWSICDLHHGQFEGSFLTQHYGDHVLFLLSPTLATFWTRDLSGEANCVFCPFGLVRNALFNLQLRCLGGGAVVCFFLLFRAAMCAYVGGGSVFCFMWGVV
jgi:hypothetical protein